MDALQCGKPLIIGHNTPWNKLEEYHAGINTDIKTSSIIKAIERFVRMSDDDFLTWQLGARKYFQEVVKSKSAIADYRAMFLNQC